MIHIPCQGVASHLITTVSESEYYLSGKSGIGTYLTDIVRNYYDRPFGYSKVIWDIAAIANAGAGFNVEPGDVIKVYIVDALSNSPDSNPVLLQ